MLKQLRSTHKHEKKCKIEMRVYPQKISYYTLKEILKMLENWLDWTSMEE